MGWRLGGLGVGRVQTAEGRALGGARRWAPILSGGARGAGRIFTDAARGHTHTPPTVRWHAIIMAMWGQGPSPQANKAPHMRCCCDGGIAGCQAKQGSLERWLHHPAIQEPVAWTRTPVTANGVQAYTAHPSILQFSAKHSDPIYNVKPPNGTFNKRCRQRLDAARDHVGAGNPHPAARPASGGRGSGRGRGRVAAAATDAGLDNGGSPAAAQSAPAAKAARQDDGGMHRPLRNQHPAQKLRIGRRCA